MIIAIGDVHGTTYWKDIVAEYKKTDEDTVVFLGDYVDSLKISSENCLQNLKELFEYAHNIPNVHMLVGNHDYHYMNHSNDKYSGYNLEYAPMYNEVYKNNYELLKVVHIQEIQGKIHVFSHAGVSNTFLAKHNIQLEDINNLWESNPSSFAFNYSVRDYYGNHPSQSPLWIRPQALLPDCPIGYNQIVGHTNLDWATTMRPHGHEEDGVTIVCTEDQYGFLLIEN
jgi:hypothetical protein